MEMGSADKSGKIPLPTTAQGTPPAQGSTRKRVADRADQELAGEKAGDKKVETGTALHAEKIDEIRRKIDSGFYTRDDVKKMIAERLGADLRGRAEE